MKLIFAREGLRRGDVFSPNESDRSHLLRVLRVSAGDELDVSDGRQMLRCAVDRAGKTIVLRVLDATPLEDRRVLSLAIARIDADRMAVAVSAAAQMAARDIWIVASERAGPVRLSIPRLDRVAREVAKQVGCPFLPAIREMPGVDSLSHEIRARTAFLLDPDAAETLIEKFPRKPGEPVMLLIGPAGDFSDAEKTRMRAAGVLGVRLGDPVLRSETAAVAALGIASTCLRMHSPR